MSTDRTAHPVRRQAENKGVTGLLNVVGSLQVRGSALRPQPVTPTDYTDESVAQSRWLKRLRVCGKKYAMLAAVTLIAGFAMSVALITDWSMPTKVVVGIASAIVVGVLSERDKNKHRYRPPRPVHSPKEHKLLKLLEAEHRKYDEGLRRYTLLGSNPSRWSVLKYQVSRFFDWILGK